MYKEYLTPFNVTNMENVAQNTRDRLDESLVEMVRYLKTTVEFFVKSIESGGFSSTCMVKTVNIVNIASVTIDFQ